MTSDVSPVSEKNNNESNEILKLDKEDDDIEILSVEEVEPISSEELSGIFCRFKSIGVELTISLIFIANIIKKKKKARRE